MTAIVEPTAPEGFEPTYCPSWCDKDHLQDFAEGATVEQAREHLIGGPGAVLPELRNIVGEQILRPGGGVWNLTTTQDTALDKATVGIATINLEVHDVFENRFQHNGVTLHLTVGDALELIAGLTHQVNKLLQA